MRLVEHVGPGRIVHEVLGDMTHHDDEICNTRGYVVGEAEDPLESSPADRWRAISSIGPAGSR